MKHELIYKMLPRSRPSFPEYQRTNSPINVNHVTVTLANNPHVVAHDFVDYPSGYPAGTLIDEVIAIGPMLARFGKAGQFLDFLINEFSERLPADMFEQEYPNVELPEPLRIFDFTKVDAHLRKCFAYYMKKGFDCMIDRFGSFNNACVVANKIEINYIVLANVASHFVINIDGTSVSSKTIDSFI